MKIIHQMGKLAKLEMKSDNDDDEDESGGGGRGEQRDEKRGETERQRDRRKTDMDPKHLCFCANHSQDHNRLPVPRSKQALSRRLQV